MSVSIVNKKKDDAVHGDIWTIEVRGARPRAKVEVAIETPYGGQTTRAFPNAAGDLQVATYALDKPGDYRATVTVDGDPVGDPITITAAEYDGPDAIDPVKTL